jgi:hypothetical protein
MKSPNIPSFPLKHLVIGIFLLLGIFIFIFIKPFHNISTSSIYDIPEFPTEAELNCFGFKLLYGFLDSTGNLSIRPQYVHASYFFNGIASVWTKYDRLFIDKKGSVILSYQKVVTSLTNDSGDIKWAKDYAAKGVYFFNNISEGKVVFPLNGRWGFVDSTGKVIIRPKYQYASDFREGLASVCINGKYGFINPKGSLVIPCSFNRASVFSEGLAGVSIKNKWGFINRLGRIVIPLRYEQQTDCCEHISSPYYMFHDSTCIVLQNNIFMRIDHDGLVIDTLRDKDLVFWAPYTLFSIRDSSGLHGFKNQKGIIAIKPQFSFTENIFSEGLAYAAPNKCDKYGYIDTTGNFVIQPKYDFPGSFGDGLAVVGLGEVEHYDRQIIDKHGNVVYNKKWLRSATKIEKFSNGMAAICFRDEVWKSIANKIP